MRVMNNFVIQKNKNMLTEEEIMEFKRLVLEVYGVKLTNEQAEDQGSRLIRLFEMLLKKEMNTKDHSVNKNKKVAK